MTRSKKRPKKAAKKTADPEKAALDRLAPEEAAAVLRRLLAERRELVPEAEAIATSLLRETSMDDVAADVEDALRLLDMDDLADRAGDHAGGYTHPSDAAGELLEEAVAPFFEHMDRLLKLDLQDDALECCRGIVVGLYRARDLQDDEILGWAPDSVVESACNALVAWHAGGTDNMFGAGSRRRRSTRVFPDDLLERLVPEWRDLIERIESGR